jgi:hypothetical protein
VQVIAISIVVSSQIGVKWSKVFCVLSSMAAYGFLTERIDLVTITFRFLILMVKYKGPIEWFKAFVGGVTSSALSYIAFVYFYRRRFPIIFLDSSEF